jgi:mannitol-1-phosphate/altronate dehydrogenase
VAQRRSSSGIISCEEIERRGPFRKASVTQLNSVWVSSIVIQTEGGFCKNGSTGARGRFLPVVG